MEVVYDVMELERQVCFFKQLAWSEVPELPFLSFFSSYGSADLRCGLLLCSVETKIID